MRALATSSHWTSSVVQAMAANLLVLVVLLVPVELIFGNWIRPFEISDLRRFSIPVGVTFNFDTSELYTAGPRNPIVSSRDEWGLRGSFTSLSQVNVLSVGGSTTEQRYLDDLATWQAVAERELRARGVPIVIANAGVDGQSTVGHAFNFDFWFPLLRDLHPRYVVFYVGVNDILRRADRGRFDAAVDPRAWRSRSATYQLYRTVMGNLTARGAGVTHGRRPPVNDTDFTSEGLLAAGERAALSSVVTASFLEGVDHLRQKAEAMDAVPVFMTQTAFAWSGAEGPPRGLRSRIHIHDQDMNYADVSAIHQAVNKGLRGLCSERRLICLDVANDVAFDGDDFYDYLHNTPRGADKLGRYLADHLATLASGPPAR